MELLDQLKSCRAGALATLDLFDLLIARVEGLSALTAPVTTNGKPKPAAGRGRPTTRVAVLAALGTHWASADDIVKATAETSTPASVYKMLQTLAAEGEIKRTGTRNKFQYSLVRRKAIKTSKPRKGGRSRDTRPAILAAAADWVSTQEIRKVLVPKGITESAIASALHRLSNNKQLERRGKFKSYQYKAK